LPTSAQGADQPPVTLIVLDPPAGFEMVVTSLGFVFAGRVQLVELEVVMTTIHAPSGHSESQARKILLKRFPKLTIDGASYAPGSMDPARMMFP
jgi:hypothetical protein